MPRAIGEPEERALKRSINNLARQIQRGVIEPHLIDSELVNLERMVKRFNKIAAKKGLVPIPENYLENARTVAKSALERRGRIPYWKRRMR